MSNERILIVDDEPEFVRFAAKCLERMDYVVADIATTGEAAVDAARRSKPDLVLMDIYLKGKMDGIEAATQIRSELDIPVVFLTGSDDDKTIQRARLSEPLGYLLKPFKSRELKSMVDTGLYTFRENRRRARETDRVATEHYRSLFENAMEGIFQAKFSGMLVAANPAGARMLGFESPEEMLNSGVPLQTLLSIDREKEMELRQRLEQHGAVEAFELEVFRKDGRKIILAMNLRAIRGDSGVIDLVEGSAVDITARKEAEGKLRILSRAVEQSPVSVVITDIDGKMEFVNPKFTQLTGYALSEVQGRNPRILKSGLMPPELYKDLWGTILCGKEWHGELHNKKKNGELYWEYASISPMVDANGVITHFVAVKEDITVRKRIQEKLLREQQLIRALMNNMPDSIYFKDTQSRFIRISRAMATKIGLSDPEQAMGKTDFNVFTEEHARAAYEDEQAILRTGLPLVGHEEEETWPDRPSTWVSTTKMPLCDEQGNIVGTFGISRDITERKLAEKERARMEVQLRQAQKLESIGQLAAGIAHEINTPTQYVGDNIRFLQGALDGLQHALAAYERFFAASKTGRVDPKQIEEVEAAIHGADLPYLLNEIPKAISQTLEGVERVSTIVKAMKEFSHPGPAEKTAMDLRRAIETTLLVCRNEWKYVADVITEFDDTLPPVQCVAGELNQIVLNLITNAAQAIAPVVESSSGQKGKITVRTRRDGDWAVIQVADTGAGIPEEAKSRIFDPFFTTKPVGKGTGQGLAIVHNAVVTRHGGTIDFETERGKGTTFTVRLPIS